MRTSLIADKCAFPSFSIRQDFPVLLILMFCSEGDNAPDAVHFAHQLNEWLNLVSLKVLWLLVSPCLVDFTALDKFMGYGEGTRIWINKLRGQ